MLLCQDHHGMAHDHPNDYEELIGNVINRDRLKQNRRVKKYYLLELEELKEMLEYLLKEDKQQC